MGVTCHFILDGKVQDATLYFGQFDLEASATNLAAELRRIIVLNGLDTRIASLR